MLRLSTGRTSRFPSQSKYRYGAELFYQRDPIEASMACHNTGYALLNAKASIALLDNVTLFTEAQNPADAPRNIGAPTRIG